jgi:5'-methylthioadenosine phosphorylase
MQIKIAAVIKSSSGGIIPFPGTCPLSSCIEAYKEEVLSCRRDRWPTLLSFKELPGSKAAEGVPLNDAGFMTKSVLGIIGGSGIYDLPGLTNAQNRTISSPWGEPSAALLTGEIGGTPIVFLSRHDKGHRISPSDINYRANIDVLKRAGVTDLVSLSACGSFREDLPPGTFVLVDQFVDRTYARANSFFGTGCVAHVSMAHPVSPRLRIHLAEAARAEGIAVVRDGTYVCIEGPQFSSLAESLTYKNLGYSVIGMTNLPEAKLAREAEICYATVAMVTDFDCWHPDHDAVTVQDIVKVLLTNAETAKNLVARLARDFPREHESCPIGSDRALDNALITAPEARDPELLRKLDAVAGRVLRQ